MLVNTQCAQYRLTTLEAENARLAALVEWRPMSTAPIDGTRILLYRPGNGWCIVIAWWHASAAMYGDEVGFFRDATHWMPLPPPPAALLAAIGEPNTTAGQAGERG